MTTATITSFEDLQTAETQRQQGSHAAFVDLAWQLARQQPVNRKDAEEILAAAGKTMSDLKDVIEEKRGLIERSASTRNESELQAQLADLLRVRESKSRRFQDFMEHSESTEGRLKADLRRIDRDKRWCVKHGPECVRAQLGQLSKRGQKIERELRRPAPAPRGEEHDKVFRDRESGQWAISRDTEENRALLEQFMDRVRVYDEHTLQLRRQLAEIRWRKDQLKELCLNLDATQSDVDAITGAEVPSSAYEVVLADEQPEDDDE